MATQEPYDPNCCACLKTCSHTGPHAYCNLHYEKHVGSGTKRAKMHARILSKEESEKVKRELGIID